MKIKTDNPLPKTSEPKTSAEDLKGVPVSLNGPVAIQGAVCFQYVRCGRPNCRCADGDSAHRHGPYFYRFWRDGKRLPKQYIKREEAEAVSRGCEVHAEQRATVALLKRLRRTRSPYTSLLDLFHKSQISSS